MSGEFYGSRSYIDHFREGGASHVVDSVLLNGDARLRKARKISAVLSDFLSRPLSSLSCLDIGCSGGHITRELAHSFASTIGIDTDESALALARAGDDVPGLSFQNASATELPFDDDTFDVVICNHVYEHINDQERMFDEIRRVLRPGGVCYMGAGNRFAPIEPHYRLPLLSWPPKAVSNLYLRWMKRGGQYLEQHQSYWNLRKLVRGFRVHDYTARILAQPSRFSGGDRTYDRLPTRFVPERVLSWLTPVFPTFIWILEKPSTSQSKAAA